MQTIMRATQTAHRVVGSPITTTVSQFLIAALLVAMSMVFYAKVSERAIGTDPGAFPSWPQSVE
jgi:hypothetical protein